jgi:SAM-dependent methyltransferase
MSESRWLDLRECADARYRDIHREMLHLDLLRQPGWFRPLLRRSARLRRITGFDHWSRAWEYPWAIEVAALGATPLRLLDVGGGGSPFSIYLAQRGHEVHVSDPSLDRGRSVLFDPDRGLLRNLRAVVKRALFRVAGINSLWGLPGRAGGGARYHPFPADHLQFPDRHFDRVFCLSVMEHIPHDLWPACMREFVRVLRPGGRLVFTLDMETQEANDGLYRKLLDACPLTLLGTPDYETPLRPREQQLRHPGHGYETIGLVWSA